MQMTILKKGDWVYRTLNTPKECTFIQKWYFLFAGLGFLICVGAGIYCLLWYVPHHWGSVDEDGEFTSFRYWISFWGAIFLGGGLASLVMETVKSRWMMQRRLEELDDLEHQVKDRDEEIRWYTALIRKANDPQGLLDFRQQFEEKLKNLRAAEPEFKCEYGKRERHHNPTESYTQLLKLVEDEIRLCDR
jgi:hypothetical protein